MQHRFLTVLVLATALLGAGAASAAPKKEAASAPAMERKEAPAAENSSRLPDRVIRPMRAIDPITLRAEGITLRLWGIKPAQTHETPLELKALDLMDDLIQEQQVNCKIAGGVMPDLVARCATQNSQDLALELLGAGYVVVDRRQTYDSVFATGYEKAQEAARLNGKGVWAMVVREEKAPIIPKWLQPHVAIFLPMALMFGPFFGLLIVALVMGYWLKRMSDTQQSETLQSHQKEATLQVRERQVLITTLEGELTENKSKIEAFLAVYGDMLRSLKDTSAVPKYQQVGDSVQKHPGFSKNVFEANVNKLSLLDIKLAGQLSKLYAALPKEKEYISLDQTVPLDTAIKLVERITKEAEALQAPLNAAIAGLRAAGA